MQINELSTRRAAELESPMSTATTTQQHRLLVSPDGMRGAKVHPLDEPNPLYAGWTDLTDLDDNTFHQVVAGRQLVTLAAGA